MLKIVLLFYFGLFMFGCSSDTNTSNINDGRNLSITKAPDASSPISIFSALSIVVSAELDRATVNNTNVFLKDTEENTIGAEVSLVSPENNKIILTPYMYLTPATYTLVVTTGVKSISGETLREDFELVFTTYDDNSIQNPGTPITLVETNPSLSTAYVYRPEDISVAFDRYVAPSDLPLFTLIDINDSVEVSGKFDYFNSRVTFTPDTELVLGHSYDINISNAPTDMFGNTYDNNFTSANFTISGEFNTTAYSLDTNISYDIGHSAYMMDMMLDENGEPYVVVAGEGGLEFLKYDLNTSTIIGKSFTYSLTSQVTDMKFEVKGGALLVSTMSDGIFKFKISALTLNVTRENLLNAYGISYGASASVDSTNSPYRIYAVGPSFGLNVYDTNLSLIKSVDTNGSALKVASDGSTVLVADYDNSIMLYDENGSVGLNLDLNETIKSIEYFDPFPAFVATTISGNMYFFDNSNIFVLSMTSGDATPIITLGNLLYVSNGALVCIIAPDNFAILKTSGEIVSGLDIDVGIILTLDRSGIIHLFRAVTGGTQLA